MFRTSCVATILAFAAIVAAGETRYVSPEGTPESPFTSWRTAAADLESVLDVASDGDQIVVGPGTYQVTRPIVVRRNVIVRSQRGARHTVLDGGNRGVARCIELAGHSAIIDGLAIVRFQEGVRITARESTAAAVRNCIIVRNSGHGIVFHHGGSAKNCTVAYNDGAGLYAYDMGGGGDDPANLILYGNEKGPFVRESANIGLHNSHTDDPHFFSATDFRLRSDSPCIDAGRNEPWMKDARDAQGHRRIHKDVVDIGACEYSAAE
ncbi:MAG: hypothetical protein HQ581_13890 [Planctomycetes bacterium]|nr:hypothetical protein [Planctomycetota bacterium]